MTEMTLTVPDIHCGHCKSALEDAVGAIDGVTSAEVTIDARTLDVAFDESVELQQIVTAVEDQGYFVAD